MNTRRGSLFGPGNCFPRLPSHHEAKRPDGFRCERIYLAKGSMATPSRQRLVRAICALYPNAAVVEQLDTAHNRIEVGEPDPLRRHQVGKRSLVFGEHLSAVRFSREDGNTCPNYWHFSPYGFCPYDCSYCYLAGTQGVYYAPTVKIYVNLPEMLSEVDAIATNIGEPTAFYVGKLQDGLALDPLTGYSMVSVPFFAEHPFARQVILTKSAAVEGLLALEHGGHTFLSWSLNPPRIADQFEGGSPPLQDRLHAMKRCADAGYPVRAVIMPIIPAERWEGLYSEFVRDLVGSVPLERLTLGGICSYRHSRQLMERKLGAGNVISRHMEVRQTGDGRVRYAQALRIRLYSHIIRETRQIRPDLRVALCLEERAVWEALGLRDATGRCNCVL